MSDTARRAPRAHFVDLLRLLMSVQMIQGHAIDALLDSSLHAGPVFHAWTWLRGLTAVGFLVAAGVSFHLSSLARWEAYRADSGARGRRARRAMMLIAIGYALHAPAGVLTGDPELARAAIAEAQIVDVLQCIGVTILILEGITAIARSARQVVLASLVLSVLAIALAPLTATIDCTGVALPLACNYLSRSAGSLFPLLPWSGFVFAGVVVGAIALPDGARTRGTVTAVRLAMTSALVIAASLVIDLVFEGPSDPLLHSVDHNVAGAWPGFSLVRLGCVIVIAALLAAASARVVELPRALRTLSGSTLVLYVSHLLALYLGGIGLARTIGPTLSLPAAIAVAVVLILASSALALVFARAQERRALARVRALTRSPRK